jgi:hypothetical protein
VLDAGARDCTLRSARPVDHNTVDIPYSQLIRIPIPEYYLRVRAVSVKLCVLKVDPIANYTEIGSCCDLLRTLLRTLLRFAADRCCDLLQKEYLTGWRSLSRWRNHFAPELHQSVYSDKMNATTFD